MATSSACPSMRIPSARLGAGTSLAVSSLAPSFTFGGLRLAVVGLVDFLDSSPSPRSSCKQTKINHFGRGAPSDNKVPLVCCCRQQSPSCHRFASPLSALTPELVQVQERVPATHENYIIKKFNSFNKSCEHTALRGFSSALRSSPLSRDGAGAGAGAATVGCGAEPPPPPPPISRTVRTACVESGAYLAATASSCKNRFVLEASRPATIFNGCTSTKVLSCTPTNLIIFSKKSIFCCFSVTFALSNSSGVYSPSPKPVARMTAVTTSCKKRTGGFCNNLSVKLGLVMRAPNNSFVTASVPSQRSMYTSRLGALDDRANPVSVEAWVGLPPRVPPRLLPRSSRAAGSASTAFGAGSG